MNLETKKNNLTFIKLDLINKEKPTKKDFTKLGEIVYKLKKIELKILALAKNDLD